jgi:hypothetical protein
MRVSMGDPPLPIDDIKKNLKQPQLQLKYGLLDLYLSSRDTISLADFESSVRKYFLFQNFMITFQMSRENISKLFISKAAASVGSQSEKYPGSTRS